MNPTIYILSSLGSLAVDAITGLVIPSLSNYDDDTDPQTGEVSTLRNIERIDLEEWLVFWGEEPFTEDDDFDILDFGYWNKDGTYEPPEYEWRFELTEALTMDLAGKMQMPEIGTESTPHDMLRAFNDAWEQAYRPNHCEASDECRNRASLLAEQSIDGGITRTQLRICHACAVGWNDDGDWEAAVVPIPTVSLTPP